MLERNDHYPVTPFRGVPAAASMNTPIMTEMDQLLATARPRLHRIARAQGLDSATADDIVQEALVEAWHHLESLRDPTRFNAWLDGICRNVVRRRLRTIAQQARHEVPFSRLRQSGSDDAQDECALLDIADERDLDPAEAFSRQDLLTLLDQAMGLLPPSTREALVLCYVYDIPQREAAGRLGVSSNTLDVRLHRARRQFQHILQNELHAEAIACGLLDASSEAGWRDSHIWCNLCGRRRLQGLLTFPTDGRLTLCLRCPDCWPRHHVYAMRYSTASVGTHPRALVPLYKRVQQEFANFYGAAVATGYRTQCPDCRQKQVQIHIAQSQKVPTATYPDLRYFYYTCPTCGVGTTSISILGLLHPAVRQFLTDHPRSVVEPEELVDYAGRPAYRLHLTDISSAEGLTAFAEAETFSPLDIVVR